MTEAPRRLRIAQVAPPVERVPPAAYGGTERVVDELTRQLVERGHDVTLFASGDSQTPARLVPTVERALRPAGVESDAGGWFATTVKMVVEQAHEFDVIHSHLEWWSIPLARLSPVPVAATFHGRLDLPWADRLFRDVPDGMVAISRHQASTHPDVPWTIIHNGLTLDRAPFAEEPGDAFCFVGRVDAEKGIIEAIDIALRAGRRLRIAAKVGNLARQRDYYESVFRPALQRAGRSIEYLGEIQPAERDQLFAESYATLMPGAWPEPFGLVSIESLACGTPVLARRVGALPEIIREGVDGFFGDDAIAMAFFADRLGLLDRREIRERVIERFSAARMSDRYEELYTRLVEAGTATEGQRERAPDAVEVAEALAEHLPAEVMEPADARLPGVPDVTEPEAAGEEAPAAAAMAAPGIQAEIAVDIDTQAELAVAEVQEAIDSVIDSQPEPDREVSAEPVIFAETEAVAVSEPEPAAEPEAAEEPESTSVPEAAATEEPAAAIEEPVAAIEEAAADWAPELAPEAPSAGEVEAAPETIAEWAPEHETLPISGEAETEAIEAEAAATLAARPEPVEQPEPAVAELGERDEATSAETQGHLPEASEAELAIAALDEAALVEVDVVTAKVPESANGVPHEVAVQSQPEPVAEAEPEPMAVAEAEAEVVPEPEPEPVAVAEAEAQVVPEPEPKPVTVAEAEAEAVATAAPEPVATAETEPTPPQPAPKTAVEPSGRPPVAVGPGPSSPDKAAPLVPPKPPVGPAVQKPTRSISIFTRQWKGTSGRGKAASGRRREGS